ncbi:hypothetical protein [Collimonas sp.]|jgi:hypothetical protein|uniref:hypothetical protein n=1 Tax=Collimonas sp. TaxID=1963772 RepID=UPI002D05C2CB|nr:hypothetical protein [Collimonas sp.]HWW04175.1 hypothetical protein [Collimonas sp.]
MSQEPKKQSAETSFRDAYDRLRRGEPQVVPRGTPVSQNNVAREAGVDPSALKKSRFPSLIAELQLYVAKHTKDAPASARQTMLSHRKRNRSLRDRIDESSIQRDNLASLLNCANAKIVELANKVAELEAKLPPSNMTKLFDRTGK